MRVLLNLILTGLALLVPLSGVCLAIGDLGIEIEKVSGEHEKIDRCRVCGKVIGVGRIHGDADLIIKEQIENALTDRDMGFVEGKIKTQYIDILIYKFEERQGGDYAVDKPAGIGFHMHMISKGTLRRVIVCEEDQQALMDNLLSLGKFMSRGGKWVTAERLSNDCINKGLDKLLEVVE